MSNKPTSALAERIERINWEGNLDHTRSRVSLMREFLRRSALWAEELDSKVWPFFDVAALIDPSIRAEEALVERAIAGSVRQQAFVREMCVWALHYAALTESGLDIPRLPDPLEPLLVMYERGGGAALDTTGFIDIDTAAVPIGKPEQHISRKPLDVADKSRLDSLDGI
ncbi:MULTISPECIES: hypothetical protein [Streptomyces]|uniref:Uncharacterized protein n=1 Tax=Streptomyces ehimensis TaxID=68195 RepID=A0ABV9BI33_9ACTN